MLDFLSAGNEFQITLREVQGATKKQIEAAAATLKDGGYINYFGLQRFGSGSVPTHKYASAVCIIGHQLLKVDVMLTNAAFDRSSCCY